MIMGKCGHTYSIAFELVKQATPEGCPKCPICAKKWLESNGYEVEATRKSIKIKGDLDVKR